jgi:hypothetical protein
VRGEVLYNVFAHTPVGALWSASKTGSGAGNRRVFNPEILIRRRAGLTFSVSEATGVSPARPALGAPAGPASRAAAAAFPARVRQKYSAASIARDIEHVGSKKRFWCARTIAEHRRTENDPRNPTPSEMTLGLCHFSLLSPVRALAQINSVGCLKRSLDRFHGHRLPASSRRRARQSPVHRRQPRAGSGLGMLMLHPSPSETLPHLE